MKVESIILVTADWEKAGQYAMKVCDAVSKAQNVPLEVKKEDYDFLIAHGVKDEFGGIDIPQIFLKLEDGTVKYIMSRIPDKSDGMPDIEKGIQLLTEAIKAQ
ncbi:MAG: hypothetical protein ACO0C9_06475 [Candidatus Methanosuratincola verstraetei]|jgi:hypothetical protein|uniref:Thioredoxin family protein n=1 Tax=Methanosuratincola subterraneus TaxID=2593994 RepID=A0A3S3SSQ7_METS7|nr:MAG: hypothetical protein Metus_0736 [Candidatus Methanosuratincola subterraneus]